MADYFNVEQDEFNPLTARITAIHSQELTAIQSLSDQLRTLMTSADGFQADALSGYIVETLDLIEGSIKPLIEQKFALTEQEISSFIGVVNNVDTLC